MKSFRTYISKQLSVFLGLIFALIFLNSIMFGWTFYNIMHKDYGSESPQTMLEETASSFDGTDISSKVAEKLTRNNIWAFFLNEDGVVTWSHNKPKKVPNTYKIKDVAVFAKGYIQDYPVFTWECDGGIMVLGYPKDSYTKITSNYFSLDAIRKLPIFILIMFCLDIFLLFIAYFLSKRKIVKTTEPIIAAIKSLSDGKSVSISVDGELAEIAEGVNRAAIILDRQNQARANWISGVSHDIRTPLSMIMGYAQRISDETERESLIHNEAVIISKQSMKIKELVQDLNLVSQLEYSMQPLKKTKVRFSVLLRSYVAELLNEGIPEKYSINLEVSLSVEQFLIDCDERLMKRAIGNLVQNSIRHNPKGCEIVIRLNSVGHEFELQIKDNGVGLSEKRLRELQEIPHYMESTDERLDLRHGLGLIIVRQIIIAHEGKIKIDSEPNRGYATTIFLPISVLQNLI